MFCLNAADYIAGVASVASQLTCTIEGFELTTSGQTYKILDQRQLPSSAATLYTAPASTQSFVLSIHVVNNDTVARTFQLFVNGTADANDVTPDLTVQPGGFAIYTELAGWRVYNSVQEYIMASMGSLLRVTNFIAREPASAGTDISFQYCPGIDVKAIFIECIGAGGGGGGVLDAASNSGAGGGGGGGAYSATYTTVMTSYLCRVGTGGGGGAAGANDGANGKDTMVGAVAAEICMAKGGAGGKSDTVLTIHVGGLGGLGGVAASGVGDIKIDGRFGGNGISLAAAQAMSGNGGDSKFGSGASGRKSQGDGVPAQYGYGGGGSGGCDLSSAASQAGGNGANGLIRIWEFS